MVIITLTTDFGLTDGYDAAMKGIILSINPDVNIIDITHSIQPQNIHQGAFVLYTVTTNFPSTPKPIHVGVIDPGVGTLRDGLIFKCRNGVLVGPDNGLLAPAAEHLKIEDVFKINNFEYCLTDISSTFHGRDIFAPIAAHISKGIPIEKLGQKVDKFVKLDLFDVSESDNGLSGIILNIDRFGNIITNISKDLVERYFTLDEQIVVSFCSGRSEECSSKIPLKVTYAGVPKGALLATISSSGFLEVAGNQCNAGKELDAKVSDKITIKKI